jgi:hypothetical protein
VATLSAKEAALLGQAQAFGCNSGERKGKISSEPTTAAMGAFEALASGSLVSYYSCMDTNPQQQAERAETEQERLARELRLIEEAEAEADAGQLIPQAEMNAWIASLGTDHPLPPPEPTKRR